MSSPFSDRASHRTPSRARPNWPRRVLAAADEVYTRVVPPRASEQGSLVVVLFHSLYRDASQLASQELAPNQNVTVEDLERFLGTMLEAGYNAVSPDQVDRGLPAGAHHLLVTFDDGYYNNHLATGVLSRLHVPALFFVSSGHVLRSEAFWWDALARELGRQGAPRHVLDAELRRLKLLTPPQVEAAMRLRFGPDVLRPCSDLDRPFEVAELRDFARERWVHIGNHTCDHAILPNCSPEEISRQLAECQRELTDITGTAPLAVAYPNGNYSAAVVDAALAAGLRLGFTVRPFAHALPVKPGDRMTIGRYMITGDEDFGTQLTKMQARYLPSNLIKSWRSSPY